MNNLLTPPIADTSNLTPIEIALGIEKDGMTTAKKLYEFLGLNPAVYARWCKSNISENEFAEEGTDYEVYYNNVENPQGGRPTQDFKLTARFAKKLSTTQKNERGEEAREYFASVEDGAKKMILQKKVRIIRFSYLMTKTPKVAEEGSDYSSSDVTSEGKGNYFHRETRLE